MTQQALTLIASFDDRYTDHLRSVLSENKEACKTALRTLGTIHYARWVIVDSVTIGEEVLPMQLVFSSNFDGDIDTHLNDLAVKLAPLLDILYEHATGYSPENRLAFLTQSRLKEAAFYQGAPGRTLSVIAEEKELHQSLRELIRGKDWKGMSAQEIHQSLQNSIFSKPEFTWAKTRIKTPKINILGVIFAGIILIILLPVILLWAVYIQIFHERTDKPLGLTPNQLADAPLRKMEKDEDFFYQNQFSQVINMKPGKARLITVNGFYLFSRVLIKFLFVKGKLMGIPTIHFARWVQINDKKRMLFFSNFDGSWTQYLGDFIDKSGWGLTGIFSNTKGFPKAFMLIAKGAYNERQFLAWARYTQIQTQIWYAADTSQSIKNINNNTIVRNQLSKKLSERRAKQFLARI